MTMDIMMDTIDRQYRLIGVLKAEVERLKAAPPRPTAIVHVWAIHRLESCPVVHGFEDVDEARRFTRECDVAEMMVIPEWTWHPAKSIGVPSPPPWERRDFRGVPTPAEDPDPPIDWSEPGDGMPIGDACK